METDVWDFVANAMFLVGRLHAAAFRWKQNGACSGCVPQDLGPQGEHLFAVFRQGLLCGTLAPAAHQTQQQRRAVRTLSTWNPFADTSRGCRPMSHSAVAGDARRLNGGLRRY